MTQFIGPDGNPITGDDYLVQMILDRVLTEPGSRTLRPTYGAGLHDFLDEPLPQVLSRTDVVQRVERALVGMPGLIVRSITISAGRGEIIIGLTLETEIGSVIQFSVVVPIT